MVLRTASNAVWVHKSNSFSYDHHHDEKSQLKTHNSDIAEFHQAMVSVVQPFMSYLS